MKRWLCAAFALLPLIAMSQTGPLYDEAVTAFKKGDYGTARQLLEAVVAQNPNDARARNLLRAATVQEKGGSLESSLKQVILPTVDLKETSGREAFLYVAQKVKEASGGKVALNLVWLVPETNGAKVTLSLQNIPTTDVLKYLADLAGYRLAYEAHALKVSEATSP